MKGNQDINALFTAISHEKIVDTERAKTRTVVFEKETEIKYCKKCKSG